MKLIRILPLFIMFAPLNFLMADTIKNQNNVIPPDVVSNSATRPTVQMADVMFENGKIYVVVLVLLTIFAGIIFFLYRIEKKLNKLEKEKNNKI